MRKRKSINKGMLLFSKSERVAIITLLSIITILLGFSIFRPAIKLTKAERKAFHNLDSMIALQEAAKAKEAISKAETDQNTETHPLASNTPTPKNKSTNWKTKSDEKPPTRATPVVKKEIPILDINVADSVALTALPQIAEVMGSRIQRYRDRLGGFVTLDQLFEIKGMDTERFEAIKPYIILENKNIKKINVNQDEFKTLLRHPYLEYEQVKAIVNHRERKGWIKDWKELEGLVGTVNPLLEKYVEY